MDSIVLSDGSASVRSSNRLSDEVVLSTLSFSIGVPRISETQKAILDDGWAIQYAGVILLEAELYLGIRAGARRR